MAKAAQPSATVVAPTRQLHKVKNASGHDLNLLTRQEKAFYEDARDKYLAEFKFTIASDMRALDRLLLLEVQMHRAQVQLASGVDYDNVALDPSEEVSLRRAIKELVPQIADVQKDLGLTKAQRDSSQDSVGAYIQKLKLAAKEHGVKREKEVSKAIELIHELFALCGAYQRSNENERRKLGFESADDIVEWVMDYAKSEFDAIDAAYRAGTQKYFVREL